MMNPMLVALTAQTILVAEISLSPANLHAQTNNLDSNENLTDSDSYQLSSVPEQFLEFIKPRNGRRNNNNQPGNKNNFYVDQTERETRLSHDLIRHYTGVTKGGIYVNDDYSLDMTPEAQDRRALSRDDLEASNPLASLQAFEKRLQAGLKGQPEVVELLMSFERRIRIHGPNQRKLPEIAYLMGLPGTGKDTAAESYLAAKFRRKDAFRQHMHVLKPAKSKADLWKVFGSATGYIGSSDSQPEFLRFLVQHSGGRYISVSLDDGKEFFVENPGWRPGMMVPSGFFAPENAVVLVQDFHLWSKEAKSDFLQFALEKGTFPVNSPGQGVAELIVPVTFIIASNEGIELLAARDNYGRKIGPSLSHEALMQNHAIVNPDKRRLIEAIKSQEVRQVGRETSGGAPEELLARIPLSHYILMRPLSEETLKEIVKDELKGLEESYANAKGSFGNLPIKLDLDGIASFIVGFNFDAESGAREAKARIKWIEDAVLRGVFENFDQFKKVDGQLNFNLVRNQDRTYSLDMRFVDNNKESRQVTIPILETANEKPIERMSPERIDELSKIDQALNQQVFGIRPLAGEMRDSLLISEQRYAASIQEKDSAGEKANIKFFLGLSSTGKTETAKVFSQFLPHGKDSMLVIDCSTIRTMEDLKIAVLGTRDGYGRPQRSKFMEHYDKYNGRVLLVLDEIANANFEVLKGLYDLFREPLVTTFKDGIPRKMGGVTIIGTGNAGEKLAKVIPHDAPKYMKMSAIRSIYEQLQMDPGSRLKIVEEYFPSALIARIGEDNFHFFMPLGFREVRELSMLKLEQALNSMQPSDSQWGWQLGFASVEDYEKFLETIEVDGFVVNEQGASIDRFVKETFARRLFAKLLMAKIPVGKAIAISFDRFEIDPRKGIRISHWLLHIEGETQPLSFQLRGVQDNKRVPVTESTQIITAYHEVGHELVRSVLLPKKYRPKLISIVNGIAEISGAWIYYLGIAQSERQEYADPTRENIVAEMAVLMAGDVAERMVADRSTGGKANDIQRAYELAKHAIVKLGLSPEWGDFPAESSLSRERQEILEKEITRLIAEARLLAEAAIRSNYETHFIPMALELAEKGKMYKEEIEKFYQEKPLKLDLNLSKSVENKGSLMARLSNHFFPWLNKSKSSSYNEQTDAQLLPSTPLPRSVANIDEVIAQERQREIDAIELDIAPRIVDDPSHFPSLGLRGAGENLAYPSSGSIDSCGEIFVH